MDEETKKKFNENESFHTYMIHVTTFNMDSIKSLRELVYKLIKIIIALIFLMMYIVSGLSLWKLINAFLKSTSNWWNTLSESYHIMIIGFFLAVISGALAYIVGYFALRWIKKKLSITEIEEVNNN